MPKGFWDAAFQQGTHLHQARSLDSAMSVVGETGNRFHMHTGTLQFGLTSDHSRCASRLNPNLWSLSPEPNERASL